MYPNLSKCMFTALSSLTGRVSVIALLISKNQRFDIFMTSPINISHCATENRSISIICTTICKFLNELSKRFTLSLRMQLRLNVVTVVTAMAVTIADPRASEISKSFSSLNYLDTGEEMPYFGGTMRPTLSLNNRQSQNVISKTSPRLVSAETHSGLSKLSLTSIWLSSQSVHSQENVRLSAQGASYSNGRIRMSTLGYSPSPSMRIVPLFIKGNFQKLATLLPVIIPSSFS